MAKAKKKSAKEASKTFHDIMKASVKDKTDNNVKAIKLPIGNTTYIFNYSIKKISDENKKDRFWIFNVTHTNDSLSLIPKSFTFKHDTFHNVTEGKIGTWVEYVSEQIMMKELS